MVAGIGATGHASGDQPNADGNAPDGGRNRVSFSEPVRLNPPGKYGYEPSVNVDQFGTIYATAHKASVVNEGTQLASFFWYSADGGETWHDMPSPADVDDKLFAFEGHIAVDDAGAVYYCDTDLGDNTFSRWLTEPSGPVYDRSKVQGTTAVDDRPWLRAHGDGIVHYLGNNGTDVPAPNNEPGERSRIWYYRSTDGGLTWSPGHGFANTEYLSLAASDDERTVYAAGPSEKSDGTYFEVFTSPDRGQSWTRDTKVEQYETAPSEPFHAWSATDRAANPYHFWIDDDPTGDVPGRLKLTRGQAGNWRTLDVTPFDGTFAKPWIGAGRDGLVAAVFYGAEQVTHTSDQPRQWYPYALVSTNATDPNPRWQLSRLTDYRVGTQAVAPGHMFEVVVGPADRIHVTFARELDSAGTVSNPTRTYRNNLFYTQGRVG
jgi:photosystem II stability/assembly factor-like uncharacterized protein